jgi:DNA-binding transcriptional MocR family regulator
VAGSARFTKIPKVDELVSGGVPVYALGTLCALSDHANSKNGLCWPSMNRLARILGCSVRTVQRHLHLLKDQGFIEFVERRRNRGRYSSYLYRVVHIVRTTGHGRRVGGRFLYKELKVYRTRQKPQNQENSESSGRQNDEKKATSGSLSRKGDSPAPIPQSPLCGAPHNCRIIPLGA